MIGRVQYFLADNLFQFFKSGDIRKAIEEAVDKIPVCVPENINLPEKTRGVYVEKNKVMEPTAPPYCGGYSTNDAINIYIQQSIHIKIR